MKILLVEPPISPFDVPTGTFGLPPPHHLERLAGCLLQHHDVAIVDLRIEDSLQPTLSTFDPEIVGVSCVAANFHLAVRVLREAKAYNPHIVTVIGGHHPSLCPSDCDDLVIDFTVIGEGEETLQELVATVESRRSPAGVAGIAFRDGETGRFVVNPKRPLMCLDKLPAPARHLTRRYRERKLYYRASWRPVDLIISSRGCPYRCTFCGLWKINDGRYRYRDVESIVDELESIEEPYVCFVDDNTLGDVRRASELVDRIADRGLDKIYELYSRADTVVRHPQLIEKWRSIGMELLLIGLEACDEETLRDVNKRISIEANQAAIEICRDLDVEIVSYLLVDPRFDRDDFRRLADYVADNNLTHPIFTVLSPFPGTDLYEEVRHSLTTDRLDLIDFYHAVMPTTLPLEEFYEEFRKLYKVAYPFKEFLKGAFRGTAMLSPSMTRKNLEIRRRMKALAAHHDSADPRLELASAFPSAPKPLAGAA